MSTAATPKGERRRQSLVDAAADLLAEGGFDAVRHRAVASRADLPLASTTYYFESLDELIAAAVERIATRELDTMRAHVRRLDHRPGDDAETVDVLVDLLVGPHDEPEENERERLVVRYEWIVAAARREQLRGVQIDLREQLADVVADALDRLGRDPDARLRKLLEIVDGAMIWALGRRDVNVREETRSLLLDVIGIMAPLASATAESTDIHIVDSRAAE
ncbi:TetR family transcriptional regulator [Rhodococcus rhodnii]|uniref:HTH tetR-type domain-containing protein n=2 Tax=Rhodococcus rhodnii TaxID=38312 RepID=R7WH59_9NOCA|nr:TetR family transcriptional regulator [Rhodococcus rhodnii]EOM74433.1 hypothetical protein Rrhod_4235 [Rhodococcus rhodnii LMG 5362]TXG89141.1 TetR family transcriptional regulator [Rhodococcus rhodnii]